MSDLALCPFGVHEGKDIRVGIIEEEHERSAAAPSCGEHAAHVTIQGPPRYDPARHPIDATDVALAWT